MRSILLTTMFAMAILVSASFTPAAAALQCGCPPSPSAYCTLEGGSKGCKEVPIQEGSVVTKCGGFCTYRCSASVSFLEEDINIEAPSESSSAALLPSEIRLDCVSNVHVPPVPPRVK